SDDLSSSSLGTQPIEEDQRSIIIANRLCNETLSANGSAIPTSVTPKDVAIGQDQSQQIHRDIRRSICEALRLNEQYGVAQAAAIALACHPWPDQCIAQKASVAIASELLPGFNANHPSFIEIAVDRLLR